LGKHAHGHGHGDHGDGHGDGHGDHGDGHGGGHGEAKKDGDGHGSEHGEAPSRPRASREGGEEGKLRESGEVVQRARRDR
jgi:hypothetical protein